MSSMGSAFSSARCEAACVSRLTHGSLRSGGSGNAPVAAEPYVVDAVKVSDV
jgi:hypothetical protein